MVSSLKKIWDQLEQYFIVFFFVVILVTITVQIVARTLFNSPPMWTEELARFSYIWMVFMGFSWVTKNGTNICIDIVSEKITGRKKAIFTIIIDLISILLFAFIFRHSIDYVKFSMANPAPAMRFPIGIVYIVCPIAMILCIIRSIERIINYLKRLKAGDLFPEYHKLAQDVEVDLLGGWKTDSNIQTKEDENL